ESRFPVAVRALRLEKPGDRRDRPQVVRCLRELTQALVGSLVCPRVFLGLRLNKSGSLTAFTGLSAKLRPPDFQPAEATSARTSASVSIGSFAGTYSIATKSRNPALWIALNTLA